MLKNILYLLTIEVVKNGNNHSTIGESSHKRYTPTTASFVAQGDSVTRHNTHFTENTM